MRILHVEDDEGMHLDRSGQWTRATSATAASQVGSSELWDVVLVGPTVEEPLKLMQSLRKLAPTAEILVVGRGDGSLVTALQTLPFVDHHVRCIPPLSPQLLRETVEQAGEGARLRRRHRATLKALGGPQWAPTTGSPPAPGDDGELPNRMLAVVAHDLRTPLGGIGTALALIEAARDFPDQQDAAIARGWRAVRRMERLISDLLDTAAIERGTLSLKLETIEIDSVLRELFDAHAELARDKGLELECERAPGVRVEGDGERLVQAIGNLVSNAIKFTDTGVVGIAAAREGDTVVVTVSDTGPGVKAAEAQHMFERFWRGDRDGSGTGLGLSITKGIVAQHGGSIHVDSEPGRGTTFRVCLPASQRGG